MAMDAAPPPPPLRAPAQLPDEVIEDIFLRVPPSDPKLLLRAALACKSFARLFAGRIFRRRYRERHGGAAGPILLGFLANLTLTGGVARFIPAAGGGGFCPARDDRRGYRAHDARHGRVLLTKLPLPGTDRDLPPHSHRHHESSVLAVWDPTTDELRHLPLLHRRREVLNWNAAVLCGGAAGAGAGFVCDHIDCHGLPFLVVFVGFDDNREMFAHVFSSASGAWGAATTATARAPAGDLIDVDIPGVLARNALYFMLLRGNRILRFDLATRKLAVIRMPPRRPSWSPRVVLMAAPMAGGGGLGFAEVCWWTSVLRVMELEDGGGWVLNRYFDLNKLLPAHAVNPSIPKDSPRAVAYAHGVGGVGVVFLKTIDGLYTFDLKSRKATKIPMISGFYDIVPYVSIYTPVLRAALATSGEGSSAGASQTQGAQRQKDFLALAM
ncbi:unnamed protein product [Urochloa humidicola]